ncbi:nitrate- and nitrite sensing domain-containing protein [Actinocorallia sp. A-T 12471]|uniref:sensor histidine kinase n=1 Tax=Actinocorallia sp. A-T 12471 TaxID=3089813 RepID=UPI0029CE5769|nr:nitrate- and nitrite sensing domain-containing protein [Actinocorallia sp. A-T 12471]MDX6739741.1 nitrate- and nitrite sensing domain-containing protein [Actinocorallia sp. A-T 12471]
MRRSRSQPIRSAIVSLIAVPLTTLVLLWAFTAFTSLGDGMLLARAQSLDGQVVRPTQTLIAALQNERMVSMAALAGSRTATAEDLAAQRQTTDDARTVFETNTSDPGLRDGIESDIRSAIDILTRDLGGLDLLRSVVDGGAARSRPQVLSSYGTYLDHAFAIYRSVSPPDLTIAADVATLTSLGMAREQLSRMDAALAGRLDGGLTAWDRKEVARAGGARDLLYTDTLPRLRPADRDRYTAFLNTIEYQRLQQFEDRITRNAGPVAQVSWDANAAKVQTGLLTLEEEMLGGITSRAEGVAIGVLLEIGIAGGLGLGAIVGSIVIAWRVSRRLIRESRALADTVGDFTRDQLPVMAELVRNGQRVGDEPIEPGVQFSVTEIERIFRSFTSARAAVLEAAMHEAATMANVREVFVNLASRNQALLHRQLSLLDEMEREADDSAQLGRLFQLDHLATRMRRHAEGLVILAGKAPGRGWRSPVPLVDVVRGAASEVEDYTRVRVLPMPRIALVGPAVADTIHLLADLIENAVQYSPPDTAIEVSGQGVAAGYVLEIEDRGLGLPPEVIEQLNERLAAPPEFTLSDTARLGLFVVGRLAKRHGIRVSLRVSPYGGTTAVVFLPRELLAADVPDAPAEPSPALRAERVLAAAGGPAEPRPVAVLREEVPVPDVPAAPQPPADGPAPEAVAPEEAPEQPAAQPDDALGMHLGLPRRRRKTRTEVPATPTDLVSATTGPNTLPAAGQGAVSGPNPMVPEPPERSPDNLRLRMSAMQRGWERGRADSAASGDEHLQHSEEHS